MIQLARRHVLTEKVAAIVGEPEILGHGMPGKAHGVANAACEYLVARTIRIHAGDHGVFGLIADIARRADGNVQLAVGTEGDVLPAVVRILRQIVTNDFRLRDLVERGLDGVVPQDAAHLGDVQRAIAERDTVRPVQLVGQHTNARLAAARGAADRVDLAAAGSDEHRATRPHRHGTGTRHIIRINLESESGRQAYVAEDLVGGGTGQCGSADGQCDHARNHAASNGTLRTQCSHQYALAELCERKNNGSGGPGQRAVKSVRAGRAGPPSRNRMAQ